MNRAEWADRLCDALGAFEASSLTTEQIAAVTVMLESFGDQPHAKRAKDTVLQLIPGGVA